MPSLRFLPDMASPPRQLTGVDALHALGGDRLQILALGHRYLASKDDEGNGRLCDRVCALLTVNMLIEGSLLYPFARCVLRSCDWLTDAEIAHYVIKGLIAQLHGDDLRLRHRDAVFTILVQYTAEHFKDASAALYEPLATLAARHPELTRELGLKVNREKRRLDPWFGLAEEAPPRSRAR